MRGYFINTFMNKLNIVGDPPFGESIGKGEIHIISILNTRRCKIANADLIANGD